MPLALLPLLLLALPITEIAVFILVGRWIGLLPTLGLIIFSAIIGALLLKRQGLGTMRRIAEETQAGRVPARELVHGVMIVAAGLLLITPGLVTDVVGFLLFVPAVRDVLWRFLGRHVAVRVVRTEQGPGERGGRRPSFGGAARGGRADIVELSDGEFRRAPGPDSPWQTPGDTSQPGHGIAAGTAPGADRGPGDARPR